MALQRTHAIYVSADGAAAYMRDKVVDEICRKGPDERDMRLMLDWVPAERPALERFLRQIVVNGCVGAASMIGIFRERIRAAGAQIPCVVVNFKPPYRQNKHARALRRLVAALPDVPVGRIVTPFGTERGFAFHSRGVAAFIEIYSLPDKLLEAGSSVPVVLDVVVERLKTGGFDGSGRYEMMRAAFYGAHHAKPDVRRAFREYMGRNRHVLDLYRDQNLLLLTPP